MGEQHLELPGQISDPLSVPFSLPEPGKDILDPSVSSWKVDLVERSIDWNRLDVPFCLPISFLSGVEIFPNCIRTSVPKAYAFDQVVTESVVRKGKSQIEKRIQVPTVSKAVHNIINSSQNRHIHIVSCENLRRLVNVFVTICEIICDVFLHDLKVNIRSPWIGIQDCQENRLWVNLVLLKNRLQMFCTPRNIGSFSLLFKLSHFMSCKIYSSESVLVSLDKLHCFDIWILLMCFHGQENQVLAFGSFMGCEDIECFSDHFNILFIAWEDETVVNFLVNFFKSLVLKCALKETLLDSFEDIPRFVNDDDHKEEEHHHFEIGIDEHTNAELLVNFFEIEGT